MRIFRLGLASAVRVLWRPWSVLLLAVVVLSAWGNGGTWYVPSSTDAGNRPLTRSVWDSLQASASDGWSLVYAIALPCAVLGVALTAEARLNRWPCVVAHRVGGRRAYVAANIVAGFVVATIVCASLWLFTVIASLAQGGGFVRISAVTSLTLEFAGTRSYTVIPSLGLAGSLIFKMAVVFAIAFAAQAIGQWFGSIIHRATVAAAAAVGLVIFCGRVLTSQLPPGWRERADFATLTNLGNYITNRGGEVDGRMSLLWGFASPIALSAMMIFATRYVTRTRGIAPVDA